MSDTKMTPHEIAVCRSDFVQFCGAVFKSKSGRDFDFNWHHMTIARTLEKVLRGEIHRLIINMPPCHGATELVVILFTAWAFGHYPDSKFIHASCKMTLALANSSRVRDVLNCEAYREIFGDIVAEGKHTTSGGQILALGVGGSLAGYASGKLGEGFGGATIIDSPHKALDCGSKYKLEAAQDFFRYSIETKVRSPKTPIILVMPRIDLKDLSGFLLGRGNGDAWHYLKIPALGTAESAKNWRHMADGEALWPAMQTTADLKKIREISTHIFDSQYQQNPSLLGSIE